MIRTILPTKMVFGNPLDSNRPLTLGEPFRLFRRIGDEEVLHLCIRQHACFSIYFREVVEHTIETPVMQLTRPSKRKISCQLIRGPLVTCPSPSHCQNPQKHETRTAGDTYPSISRQRGREGNR